MSLSILTNISAMQTEQNLLNSSNSVATAEQDMSSGLKINSAADDAAGYAISEGLTSQINGLTEASDNAADATSSPIKPPPMTATRAPGVSAAASRRASSAVRR